MPVSTNFRRFRKLPTELRLRIWKLALPHARILLLRPRDIFVKEEQSEAQEIYLPFFQKSQIPNYRPVSTFVSGNPIPTILWACGESRMVALEHYSLMFSCLDDVNGSFAFARTYFDCSVDTLYLNIDTFQFYIEKAEGSFQSGLKNMDPDQLSKVQNLCINIPDVDVYEREAECFVAMVLSYFPGLCNLHIAVWHYLLDYCMDSKSETCNTIYCLEKNFTVEQQADLIFTAGHMDLYRNLRQYRFNKMRPELHPRMRYYLRSDDIDEHLIDENRLRAEMEVLTPGHGSAHRKLPKIEYQTVMTRQLAAIEINERKEYLADILEAQKNRVPEENRATSEEP